MRIADFKISLPVVVATTLVAAVGLSMLVVVALGMTQPARSVAVKPTIAPVTTAPLTAVTPASADNRIVLVSGRDDHGLLEEPHVVLYRAPDEMAQTGLLHDGTFARVLEIRGNWRRIQAIAPPYQTGWLDDYFLRGRALRTDGGGQVEFASARYTNEQLLIAVYPVGERNVPISWLSPAQLREVGAK